MGIHPARPQKFIAMSAFSKVGDNRGRGQSSMWFQEVDASEGGKWDICVCVCVCVCAQLCLTLCDPMDCSPQVSSVHGILQARMLEWIAFSFSRGSSRPKDQTWVFCVSFTGHWQVGSLPLHHWEAHLGMGRSGAKLIKMDQASHKPPPEGRARA